MCTLGKKSDREEREDKKRGKKTEKWVPHVAKFLLA
jgi:hypothetical protein